ncbi:MAG: helix-turn-helix domain-containing protein [Lachnospiraceae bacterium]|nr:helix-turn-helix domain-containing protein [Lachnospiraceae bacterium]
MNLDHQRELTPVLYGSSPVKLWQFRPQAHSRAIGTHWHERFEILVIDEGILDVQLNGKSYKAYPGDTVIINPCVSHDAYTTDTSVSYRVIMFELLDSFGQSEITRRVLEPFLKQSAAFQPLIKDPALVQLADAIFETSKKKPDGYALSLMGQIYSLLGILCDKYVDTEFVKPPAEGQFQDILDYIDQNYCENISSASISQRFGYSEAYFSRRFKAVTGLRPMEYIKILRLERARQLLKDSRSTISSAAFSCGFTSVNYFLRCFKARYGFTVGEYQKNTVKAAPD